ncbi:sugar phosphate isomerase/epimerase family protein [Pseudozobellia thermophila]|uniref:2-keto-myo-inositol isomerase n=1 Tax=Pseudozobellia thermophila TaxID=192903 RepID=A0A1M6JLW2_9FLAO|nr:sugar phosphate isomerase/epimerase [Pseudozobellia thermophila]SHJ47650.1 2-keto-myo-inositol isomerase [Pseudozobellia thermophila]
MSDKISRRKAISNTVKGSLAAMGGYAFATGPLNNNRETAKDKLPVRISLNCSTLLHYKLPVDVQIDYVADAGFDGIELWMRDIKTYLDKGGNTFLLKRKLQDRGLVLENIIGFSKWCSDDPTEREKALIQLRDEMQITKGLGGTFLAAPVQGIDKIDPLRYDDYAERYKAILELGDQTGVTPILELWGMGALNKVADCTHIAMATGHPKATVLLDFYHVYRGGNDWNTVDLINGAKLPVMHMNDYPATPSYEQLTDADRVLPGEGICPFNELIPKLYKAGFRGGFSVELFNKGYWNTMDAKTLLKKSYDQTYDTVKRALAPHL